MRKVPVIALVFATAALGQTTEIGVAATSVSEPSLLERFGYTVLVDAFGGAHVESSSPTTARVFDTTGRSVGLAYAKAGLWLDAEPIGFRVDLGVGQITDVLSSDTSIPVLRNLEQAYASVKFAAHRGLTVDFGRHLTCAGNETVDSRTSWLYSRSLLFGFAAPFTHTGFRLTAPLTERLTLQAGVNQGWDVIVDNNLAKSGFVSASWSSKFTSLAASLFAGPERTGDDRTWRWLVDAVWVSKLPARFEIALNVDAALEGDTAWYGAALSGRFRLSELFDFAVRVEGFNDPQNVRLKLAQLEGHGSAAWEVTASARATLTKWVQVRCEYRHDQLYGASSTPQDTLTLAIVAGL